MPYVTTKQSPIIYQMTIDDILSGEVDVSKLYAPNVGGTRTLYRWYLDKKFLENFNITKMIDTLGAFNSSSESLAQRERLSLYTNFCQQKKDKGMKYIIKKIFESQKNYINCNTCELWVKVMEAVDPIINEHPAVNDAEMRSSAFNKCASYLESVGFSITTGDIENIFKSAYRKIDNPAPELKTQLALLRGIFENDMFALYHTSAFAYVPKRSTIDAVKKHQANESKWFGKFDFSNFFGSTTEEFIMKMLSNIFPFSEICKWENGKAQLRKAIDLCMLNGGLPQGTPISPMLTNLIMIPIDYKLCNELRKMPEHFTYTRYADDILISSRVKFDISKIQSYIIDVLNEFEAPFKLNEEKTRIGSSAGRNWNLGVMLNKDNKITIGWEKKKEFKAMCHHFIVDKAGWELHDVQVFGGLISYYRSVEKDYVDYVIEHFNKKYEVDIENMIKEKLSA